MEKEKEKAVETETEVNSCVGDPDWDPTTGTLPSDFSGYSCF